MNKYKVTLLKFWASPIIVEATHVICTDGVYILYNDKEQMDLYNPQATFKKEKVLKIIRMKNKNKGKENK